MPLRRLTTGGRQGLLCENFFPTAETLHAGGAELHQAALSLLDGFLGGEPCLAEELVGIAYDLFFKRFRKEVLRGQRQVLLLNLVLRDACSGMTLTDTGMLGITFASQQLCSDAPVKDVWLGAVTMDAWRVALEDTDVVEHGSLLDKPAVYLQFRVCVDNLQGLEGYAAAVHHEDVLQRILFGVVFIDDFLVVQRSFEG